MLLDFADLQLLCRMGSGQAPHNMHLILGGLRAVIDRGEI
jgi:hypothetical protein